MDALALVGSIVLVFQERVVLSAMLEFVSFVRPSTLYRGMHINRAILVQNPVTVASKCPLTARHANQSRVIGSRRYHR